MNLIYHWTAGIYKPNQNELLHYHYLIDNEGGLHNGIFSPEDNINCYDGQYAAHTGGGNTNSIGIAFCGMRGFVSSSDVGFYPLTKIQCEAGWKLGAELCREYKISDIKKVQTHYGFGQRHPKTESYGKIDITWLPYGTQMKVSEYEKFIRNKVKWYMGNL